MTLSLKSGLAAAALAVGMGACGGAVVEKKEDAPRVSAREACVGALNDLESLVGGVQRGVDGCVSSREVIRFVERADVLRMIAVEKCSSLNIRGGVQAQVVRVIQASQDIANGHCEALTHL